MKATLDKEVEKKKAAESIEEEASRAAAAKAASITQSNSSFLNANTSEWAGKTEKNFGNPIGQKIKTQCGRERQHCRCFGSPSEFSPAERLNVQARPNQQTS